MKTTRLVLLMIALACFACRGDTDGDDAGDDAADDAADDNGDDNGDDDGGDEVTIYDVQSEAMAVGTPVSLRGVVVVGVDAFGEDQGRVFVMEPEGGAFSGVMLYLRGGEGAGLVPGDVIDVVGGEKDEFSFDNDPGSVTEIVAPDGGSISITKTGTGEVPAAEVLVPRELAADPDEAEKWEGVLVEFANVRVVDELVGVGSDATRQRTEVTGPFQVQSDLTSFDDVEPGICYSTITGIGDYFVAYKILPRSADDMVAGADGDCLPPEDGADQCGDETDNDYDGETDCQDAACIESVAECAPVESTIEEIQTGVVEDGATVSLVGVTVTAVQRETDATQNFWVADNAVAAENGGILVFWPEAEGELPPEIEIGATLDISATVQEFACLDEVCAENPLTELTFATLSNFGTGEEPTPLAVEDIATLATEGDSAPYEGVLVTIENATVVAELDKDGQFTVGETGTELIIDDSIFGVEAVTVGQCFTSITGVMNRDIRDGGLALVPRGAADIDDTACP